MGIRSSLKGMVKRAVGQGSPAPSGDGWSRAPARPASGTVPAASKAKAAEVERKQTMKGKREAIVARAHKGVLAWVAGQGGESTLAQMHEHSEKTFFIAHKSFSKLMEDWVTEGHIDYDEPSGKVVLTERGRQYAAS